VTIRIGTRGSALALWQAHHVRDRLEALGRSSEIVVITTTGDRVLDRRLEAVGGKGAFLKEIEEAMIAGAIDLAVHSLKDVPTALPAGLSLCAVLERADPRDALLSDGLGIVDLPRSARVGTTSLRRRSLVASLRPDLVLEDLRGNVDTRIARLREGRFAAILLAMAGLVRLGRAGEVTEALDPRTFVPAPGQGAIALECRSGDTEVRAAVAALDHAPTARAVAAERAFLAALGGGCNVPLGAHAFVADDALEIVGFVASPDGTTILRGEAKGIDPVAAGERLAATLVERGATALLAGSAGA
jgi:hydroxymethylbilane synthase